MSARLAVDGGEPVRTKPFPSRVQGFGDEEMAQLADVIRSGHLFRVGGEKTKAVEDTFASLIGTKHALAVTSGTAAIHTAVAAVNPDPGDEIITTPLSDMGTVIGILFQNAIPIFADVAPGGYHLDPDSVRKNITDRTRAIIVVHLWGQAANMDEFLKMGKEHNIPIIEDCAQAYLTTWKGRRVGSMGLLGCFSLQQSKHITSGDGGLVVTNDDDLAFRARLFADKGWDRTASGRGHLFLGMNYRISELQSAVTLAQLGKLEGICARRKQLGDLLTKKLQGIHGVYPPVLQDGCDTTYWYYPLRVVEEELGKSKEWFMSALGAEGVGSWGWLGKPLYAFEALADQRTFGKSHHPFDCACASRRVEYGPGLCPNGERVLRDTLVMTVHEFYSEEDVDDMAAAIHKIAEAVHAR
jgi:dTDP-4-amino-4,6-dideoxygalactose transaminase